MADDNAHPPAPYWWPSPPVAIAALLVVSVVALAFILAFRAPDGDMFKFMVGGLMTTGFASIIAYFFGSNTGSKDKDVTIARAMAATNGPPVTPEPPQPQN